MPQFGTKSLLVGIALLALWLSTLSGYDAGSDVRAAIVLVIVFAAAFAAIYRCGRRQAFWIDLAGTLVLMAIQPNWRFVPRVSWASRIGDRWAAQAPTGPLPSHLEQGLRTGLSGRQHIVYSAITDTFWAVCALSLSIVVGYIGAHIYDQSREPDS